MASVKAVDWFRQYRSCFFSSKCSTIRLKSRRLGQVFRTCCRFLTIICMCGNQFCPCDLCTAGVCRKATKIKESYATTSPCCIEVHTQDLYASSRFKFHPSSTAVISSSGRRLLIRSVSAVCLPPSLSLSESSFDGIQ